MNSNSVAAHLEVDIPLLNPLSHQLSDMGQRICSKASWPAVKAVQVSRLHHKSNKASQVCMVTCKAKARQVSTHLRDHHPTHSRTVNHRQVQA